MIGDVNLFLSKGEDESDDAGFEQAELDLMIARPSHRGKNIGAEAALSMMRYGAEALGMRRYFVKIGEDNLPSLRLFRDKLGFVPCGYAECFGEVELECKRRDAKEMVEWVDRRWERLCREREKREGEGKEEGKDEVVGCREDGAKAFRLYDVYGCPLNSLEG